MRVLQLIDSLNAGGAERMAVQYANALTKFLSGSHLCVTRSEGILKESIVPEVGYLFLNKKRTFDFAALRRLKGYIQENDIKIIHAHGSSFFFAVMLKCTLPKIKIIWHEHLGKRVQQGIKNNLALYISSYFFKAIFTVNEELYWWSKKHLRTRTVVNLPNFVELPDKTVRHDNRIRKVVCVANLRVPKNHLNLVRAFKIVHELHPNWELDLIGNINDDEYGNAVRSYVTNNSLDGIVNLLGLQANINERLLNAKIGVLSSDVEGLPVALLEYGVAGLAVVTTNVGNCAKVINGFGKIVPPRDSEALAKAIIYYIENEMERTADAIAFSENVRNCYSIDSVVPTIVNLYKEVNY